MGIRNLFNTLSNSLKQQTAARAYIIVPEAVLNNEELKNLRKYLIDNHLLKQIISLPSGIFLPYTESKASVLVLQGFQNQPIEKIKYTTIKSDGFTLTNRRKRIAKEVNDLEEYLSDESYASKELSVKEVLKNGNYSFIWFKYFTKIPENYILLKNIIEEEKIKNKEMNETASIAKNQFWGMLPGKEHWGKSFVSVTTSSPNDKYKIVNPLSIAYNPARTNIGSFGINLTDKKFAVSPMYVTFKVANHNFLPEFVFLCLRSKWGIQNVKDRSFGSVRQTLHFEDLCTIPIPDINITKQKQIVDKAKTLHQQFTTLKEELENFDLESIIYAKRQ